MGRIACIDFGLKRVGVALSDERQMIASSLGVVLASKSTKETIQEILKLFAPYEIERIILGYPLHMNGKVGFLADEVNHFITLLKQQTTIEILLWDERLSTVLANRSLMEGGMSRKKRAKIVDAVSAMIILQSHLGY